MDRISDRQYGHARELAQFSEKEIEKIERICIALERRFNAEANKEAHLKFRILFERAAKEWLPFIIYCLMFAPVAAFSFWRTIELDGWWRAGAWGVLIVLMSLPILSAPFLHRKILSTKTNDSNNLKVLDVSDQTIKEK